MNSPCLHLNDGAKHQSQNREYHDPEKKKKILWLEVTNE